jgi:hypothetical protein
MTCRHYVVWSSIKQPRIANLCIFMCRIQILLFVRQYFLLPIVWIRGCEVQMNVYEKTGTVQKRLQQVNRFWNGYRNNHYWYIQCTQWKSSYVPEHYKKTVVWLIQVQQTWTCWRFSMVPHLQIPTCGDSYKTVFFCDRLLAKFTGLAWKHHIAEFWVITPCSLVGEYLCFGRPYYLNSQGTSTHLPDYRLHTAILTVATMKISNFVSCLYCITYHLERCLRTLTGRKPSVWWLSLEACPISTIWSS